MSDASANDSDGIWQQLRRRKVVQWGIAYAAAGWGFLQGLEYVGEAFGWPSEIRQVAILVVMVGLPFVIMVAWYHGDRGKQRVTGTEVTMLVMLAAAGVLFVVAATSAWLLSRSGFAGRDPLADARYSTLTDFEGIEQAAAISRDGKFAAFLSNRDGPLDAWVTQIGSGEFHNLTRGELQELFNDEIRNVDFTPDGTQVMLWARTPGPAKDQRHNWRLVSPHDGRNATPDPAGRRRACLVRGRSAARVSHGCTGRPHLRRRSRRDRGATGICGARGHALSLSHVVARRRVHLFRAREATRCHGHLADAA